jgi:outer membrane protein assembly factor BamD
MTGRLAARLVVVGLLVALGLGALGCGGSKRRERRAAEFQFLTAESLYERAIEELSERKLRRARLALERIQFTAENRPNLEPLTRLALADVAFYAGDDLSLIEARSKYLDFVTLYGDHPMAPYAQFQAGMCSLEQVRDPSRDQSQTHVAINDLREVLRRYANSRYASAARGKLDVAEANLAQHEFQVGNFYMRRKAYPAAIQRYRAILDRYPRYTEREKVYFHLGQALVLGNNEAEGRIYLDKLITEYPEGEFAPEARRLLSGATPASEGKSKRS